MKKRFVVGDFVECIDFEGATGARFKPGQAYEVTKVVYSDDGGDDFIFLNNEHLRPFSGAYPYRFKLIQRPYIPMGEPDMNLDEILAAQELVNG